MRLSGDFFGLHFNFYLGKEPEDEKLHPDESLPEESQIMDSGVTSSMPMHVDSSQDPRNFGFFYQDPFVPKSPV